ncbi:MAG TPA: 50S ribosomal protein L3, partial [Alphaproteobacteria bacterium]|nr:50S ribosomal protein L3 [Alphaproteobacteria bacterium]
GLLLIKGAVPGARGGYVLVQDAIKSGTPEKAPKPAGVKKAAETKPAEALSTNNEGAAQ